MPHEITMPQLGMAQDSGVILSWQKQPGDAVKADDILMEVETDKATMEVEVGHGGYLAEIRAETGVPIPVGDVIAIVSDNADDAVAAKPVGDGEDRHETKAAAPTTPEPPAPPTSRDKPAAPSTPSAVPILASPKAKYLAHKRGIDLGQLVRQGVAQPIHAADVERFVPQPEPGIDRQPSMMRARVERSPFDRFVDWVRGETEGAVTPLVIWSAFVTGAFRQAAEMVGRDGITVEAQDLGASTPATAWSDADMAGLASLAPAEIDHSADLLIRDLSGTALVDYRPGTSSGVPVLLITGGDDDSYDLTLHFREDVLPLDQATAFLNAIAARAAEPLRHLL